MFAFTMNHVDAHSTALIIAAGGESEERKRGEGRGIESSRSSWVSVCTEATFPIVAT